MMTIIIILFILTGLLGIIVDRKNNETSSGSWIWLAFWWSLVLLILLALAIKQGY